MYLCYTQKHFKNKSREIPGKTASIKYMTLVSICNTDYLEVFLSEENIQLKVNGINMPPTADIFLAFYQLNIFNALISFLKDPEFMSCDTNKIESIEFNSISPPPQQQQQQQYQKLETNQFVVKSPISEMLFSGSNLSDTTKEIIESVENVNVKKKNNSVNNRSHKLKRPKKNELNKQQMNQMNLLIDQNIPVDFGCQHTYKSHTIQKRTGDEMEQVILMCTKCNKIKN